MPIPSPAAGTDAIRSGHAGGARLTLDYHHARERGPAFRQTLAAASIEPAAPAIPELRPAAAGPVHAGPVYEGADALSALRRDLLSGNALAVEPAVESAEMVQTAAIDGSAAPKEEAKQPDWRHDDWKGRRLGDRPAAEPNDEFTTWLFGEDGFGFDDLIDIINPLQHIPILSSIYRWITGDEIAPAANLAGGALFGGPLGLAGAAANVAFREATGNDLGGHALTLAFGEPGDAGGADAAVDLAAAPVGPPATSPAVASHQPPRSAQQAALAPAAAALPSAAAGRAPILFVPAPPGLSEAAPSTDGPPRGRAASPMPSPADAAIAAQMRLALDKYEALARGRAAEQQSGGPLLPPSGGSLYDARL